MARTPRVGGLRTTSDPALAQADSESSALPDSKTGVYQFRSRATALRMSLKRRRIERGPEGEREEVVPRTRDDYEAPLDWVLFENNYFETPSKELAEAIIAAAKKNGTYGVGAEVWSLSDERAAQDAARERELRALIESRPDIAAKVLTPGTSDDFKLPAVPA
jgi:hypothetical protein